METISHYHSTYFPTSYEKTIIFDIILHLIIKRTLKNTYITYFFPSILFLEKYIFMYEFWPH